MTNAAEQKWLQDAADKVFRTAGDAARRDLQNDHDSTNVGELVQNAHQLTDLVILEALSKGPQVGQPVCCEGCCACCHLHVVATPLEVLGIATHLRGQMTDEFIAKTNERIERHIENTKGMSASTRRQTRTACPLLAEGRCTVYSIRPISCRSWNSLDRTNCDSDLANPTADAVTPVNIGQYVLAGRVAEGLGAASDRLGLESRSLDFVRGLQIAMADPIGTAAAWRNGSPVFAEAANEVVFPGAVDVEQDEARAALWNSL